MTNTDKTVSTTVGTTLNFLASVIKSGEPWTATCQAEFDKAHAALRAASVTPPAPERSKEEVGVKPLEWVGNEGRGAGLKYVIAEPNRTQGWRVWANLTDVGPNGMATSVGGHIVTMKAENRDAAIAAAQADYEQRILAALEPVSLHKGEDDEDGRVEIIEQSDTPDGGTALTLRQYDQETVVVAHFPPVLPPEEGVRVTPKMVGNAMQEAWDEICSDTAHHPLDIEHGKGSVLYFAPRHWADLTAMHLTAALSVKPEEQG